MAKAVKKKEAKTPDRKKRGKYDEKLQVKEGSFLDIIQASMKHADNHSAKKGEDKKKTD